MLENLKKEMESRNIKTKDIADLLGIKSPAVSKRIYGSVKISDDEKIKISKLLDINDLEYLFEDSGTTPTKSCVKTVFSTRFNELLEKDKRSQKEIAEILGVNERTISDWKLGKQNTNIEMLKKISIVLNTNLSYLSGESDDRYPSAVNYFEDSMKEYTSILNNLIDSVKSYLIFTGFDIKKLDQIIESDPLLYSRKAFQLFYNEHIVEYEKVNELNERMEEYSIQLAKKLRIKYDSDSVDNPTEDEQKLFKILDKDIYYNKLFDELEKVESNINTAYKEYFNKKQEQTVRIKKFYDDLPKVILKHVESSISDIISEYHIYDYKSVNTHDIKLKLSYMEKNLFEYKQLYNDIEKLNETEFNDSIVKVGIYSENPIINFNHKYKSKLFELKDKNEINKSNVLKFLKNKISELEKIIQNLKNNLADSDK